MCKAGNKGQREKESNSPNYAINLNSRRNEFYI